MTNDELKAIEARANAATPGPWKYVPNEGGYHFVETPHNESWDVGRCNGPFIAHARTDIPALIAALRAEREELLTTREDNKVLAMNGSCAEDLGHALADVDDLKEQLERAREALKKIVMLGARPNNMPAGEIAWNALGEE